ncbi:hypothetical protein COT75_00790 [Candidatus Beckwithbacteria bacterium CG10_big_fil_rev_8_21_14_0_10_34_10]|uniref:Nudix hydrolase domain-containing protein n=1 Tax=Candidatus Beckwithbacteria bacterium CG10_big_fil_rev_8_21_14_0_10_34_10 TaxID=1974495 RepID=A0A2H0WAL3_9BACT|nr:MAG: hypothetical protein COT75_00790 [Candidatus Beckwithbacteria bacterium CG10_big_fil_rev_8_21_14_0_10_34_10]
MITCFWEDKNKAFLRHVTVTALVIKKNKILLVKRSSSVPNPKKYCIPGGFLERDETARNGILREIKEETGYQAKVISLFRVNDNPKRRKEDRQNVDLVFLVKPLKIVQKPDKEVKKTQWFDLNMIPLEKDFAFDHRDNILLYRKYLKKKFVLPIF